MRTRDNVSVGVGSSFHLLLLAITVFVISMYFQAPYWTYLLCALGLFIYQSLDAIDGKQARRTNSCSPLGELFDHGCDSLSTGKLFIVVGGVIKFY